jgi:aspartate/tyrosine/aromatic aminotransferase
MRRREDFELSKHTINLYAGDYSKLMALYSTRVGAAKVIRDLVHAHLRKIEEEAAQRVPVIADLGIDITDEEERL